MKRLALLLAILASILAPSWAANYQAEMTRFFALQAGYEEASVLTITPIPAQSHSYVSGMPFSIEDEAVQYQNENSRGREIASWSVLSNQDFNIRIEGDPMYPVDEKGEKKKYDEINGYEYEGLGYILTLQYRLGYVVDGEEYSTPETQIEFNSTQGNQIYTTLTEGYTGGANEFIGGVDGAIFFRFDEASSKRIADNPGEPATNDSEGLPSGDYLAYVKITLESKI